MKKQEFLRRTADESRMKNWNFPVLARPVIWGLLLLMWLASSCYPTQAETAGDENKSISSLIQSFDPIITVPEHPVILLSCFGEPKRAYDLSIRSSASGKDALSELFKARLLTEIGLYERADSALNRAGDVEPLQWTGLINLWRARLNLLAGRYEEALGHLSTIETDIHGFFEAYRDYLLVEALLGAGEYEKAVALGEEFISSRRIVSLRNQINEVLFDTHVSRDSLVKALQVARNFDISNMTPERASRLATKEIDLYHQLGNTARAREKTLALAREFPKERATVNAIRRELDRLPIERFTNDELLLYGERMLDENHMQEARTILSHLRKRRLKKSLSEKRSILLADLYYREKKYSQAAELARIKYNTPSLKRYSMLILARCYRRLGRPVSAATLYESFASSFSSDAKAAEALYVASKLYSDAKHPQNAKRVLENLSEKYRSSYFGQLATLKLAWFHLQRGRHAKSASILEGAVELSRRTNEAALYYLAETYEKSGLDSKRRQIINELEFIDSTSFYLRPFIESGTSQPPLSSSGAVELEGDGGLIVFLKDVIARKASAQRKILESLPEPNRWESYKKSTEHLERGRVFIEMGFRDWAESELAEAELILKSSQRLTFELAILYDRYGLCWKSVTLYQRVWDKIHGKKRRDLARSFTLLLHPLPFPVQVMENCARERIEPHLVYAMIREESKFDLTAVSRAGAQGLMQLMPGTGKHVAQQLDLPEEVGENLFVPEINLAFGIWYASFLLRRCGGDPLMMLTAYNAGLSNAKRWFQPRKQEQSVRHIVDGITFKETRNYVKRIVESSHAYHVLYFDPGGTRTVPVR